MRLRHPLFCLLLLPSCVHLFTTRVEYTATGPAPFAAGSAFRAEFIPTGTESGLAVSAMVVGGASIAEVGPYQLRLHAFGKKGDQRWFRVTRLVLTSPGHFTAPMEKRGFAGQAEFTPTQTATTTRASLLMGTNIRLDEQRDREIAFEADVEIMRASGLSRSTLRIPMEQTKTKRHESQFILSEIWKDAHGTGTDIPAGLPPPPEVP